MNAMRKLAALGVAATLATAAMPASATDELVVTHYGALLYGVPYAVAIDKGWFKKAGLAIEQPISSKGGSTSVRNMMAGNTIYGEVALPAALAALKEGIPIRIINVGTEGEGGYYISRTGEKMTDCPDLKGKRLGFTRPRSVTESMNLTLLRECGLKPEDVKMVATGDIAGGVVALENNQVDIVQISEPVYARRIKDGKKYQIVDWASKKLPTFTQTVGIATVDNIEKQGGKLQKVIDIRKRGVEFMYANQAEAARITAKVYDQPADVMAMALKGVNSINPKWWNADTFDMKAMNNMAQALDSIGILKLPIDWKASMDLRFMPAAKRPQL
ncbi:MAG: ABC transporter substrate-binding protein [Alphaproteobacteria bacterium]|nr:ABC transporter substrate-binding protein [Alphaproteobacteria bacterium]